MKISELITQLQAIQEQHGDLHCVTPGLDETGAEEVNTVEVRQVKWNPSNPNHHGGQHDYVYDWEEPHPPGQTCLAVNIDWGSDC